MKNRYLWVFLISILIIALDQFTKYLILTNFQLGEHSVVVPGFFDISHSHNTGAAFGLLRQAPPFIRLPLLLSLPLLALIIILWALKSIKDPLRVVALAFILGGAIGNFIDRARFRFVVDFLHFYYKQWSYPDFNVADSSICIGFGLWVIYTFRHSKSSS